MTCAITDEQLHTPSDHPLWRESYYFNLHVPGFGVVEITVGLWPNCMLAERMILLLPEDGTDPLVAVQRKALPNFSQAVLASDLQALCINPFDAWRVRGSMMCVRRKPFGQAVLTESSEISKPVLVSFSLSFVTKQTVYRYDPETLTWLGQWEHYEQAVTGTGTIQVGGATYQVSGKGIRDHSWGTRDWLKPQEWYWINLLARDIPLAVVVSYGHCPGQAWLSNGFVFAAGKTQPISVTRLKADHDDSNPLRFRALELDLSGPDGSFSFQIGPSLTGIQALVAADGERQMVMSTNKVDWGIGNGFGLVDYGVRMSR